MSQLKLCFVALLWASRCSAWGLFTGAPDLKTCQGQAQRSELSDGDLTDQLNEVVLSSDHKKALAKLAELQSKPTCSRQAASRLMVSCSSLGGIRDETSRDMHYDELEDIRNAYAVSLAICQFDQAAIDTPEPCLGFRSSVVARKTRGSMAPKARSEKEHLTVCLNALFSDGSAWTTYTENHQTARIICEASRAHTERDMMIEVYKRRADVDNSRMAHYFEEMDHFVKAFNFAKSKVIVDLEQLNLESKSYLDSLQEHFSKFTGDLIRKLTNKFSDASAAADTLVKNVVRGEYEIVTRQREALEISRDVALSARDSQDSAIAIKAALHQLVDAVGDLKFQVDQIKKQNKAIEERSQGIVHYIQNIEDQLHSVSTLQEENIERAQYMAKVQAEAAESVRYWTSLLRLLGLPTWQEVVTSDFRILGIRWQVLFGSTASTLLFGNYGIVERTVQTNFVLVGAGFVASGIITVSEEAFWWMTSTGDTSGNATAYAMIPSISIRTTPIDTASSTPTPSGPTGRHPHGEVR